MAVRENAGVFDVSHMGEIETAGPDAQALLQRLLSNDVAKLLDRRGSIFGAVSRGRGRARRSLHLPARGEPLPDGHERRQPRARPRLVSRARRDFRRGRADRPDRRLRDARRPGSARAGARAGDLRRPAARADDGGHPAPGRSAGLGMWNGLHRRGRRRAPRLAPRGPRLVGRASAARRGPDGAGGARHATPGGLLPPLRERSLDRARPDRSGARLVLQGGHSLPRRGCGARGTGGRSAGEARRVRDRGARNRAPGQRRRGRRRGHQRHALAEPRRRHRDGLRPRCAARRPARAWKSTFVARSARLS